MLKAANIHDLAREFLATDGLKLKDTQKAAIFIFADWVFKAAQQTKREPCPIHGYEYTGMCALCVAAAKE